MSKTETRLHTESYYDITNWYHYIWKEKKYTYDYIGRTGVRVDEKGDPEYFQSDKIKAVNAGQYLAVTAGDFRGEGKDTIICYNGVYKSPAILEYSCELIDASRMNWVNQAAPKEGDLERWSGREETGSITYEGQVYDPQYKGSVISNVYNEFCLTKVSVGDTDYDKMSRNAPIVDMVAADVDRDGAAGTQIEDSRYDFNWDVGFRDQDGVPVVGYKLSNIKAPTMTPENFSVVKSSITNTEATLTWDVPEFTHGLNPENTYNRTIPNKVRVYVKQNNDEYDEGEYFERDINDGKLELTDLISNKTYTLCIVGYDGLTGNQSRPSQEIRFTTTNVATSHKVDIIAGKGLTRLSSSGAESQTVTGPISAVIYKVNTGYSLPDDFTTEVINGLTIEYINGNIKISGIPTRNSTIEIPDMTPTVYNISYVLDGGSLSNPVKTYIAARVNGTWDAVNAIKNAVTVTVK